MLFPRAQQYSMLDAIHRKDDESTLEGIYILTDTHGMVEYVGKTSNGIHNRLRQHITQGDRLFFSGQFYDLDVHVFGYLVTQQLRSELNLESLVDLERYLIKQLVPRLNIQHKN